MANCELKDKNYNGYCSECTSREYCMLSEILEKLRKLEAQVAEMKAAPIR